MRKNRIFLYDKKKKDQESCDSQSFSFSRDYCPTSRKIHLILLDSKIFYIIKYQYITTRFPLELRRPNHANFKFSRQKYAKNSLV